MRSYQQIRNEIARLEREARAARQAESAAVVAKLRKLIVTYGLTADDIGLDAFGEGGPPIPARGRSVAKRALAGRAVKQATRSAAGIPKYRDPESGRTWSGIGRIPDWLAAAKNREPFRIGASDALQPAASSARAEAAPAAGKTAAGAASRKAVPAGHRTAAAGKRRAAGKSAGAPGSAALPDTAAPPGSPSAATEAEHPIPPQAPAPSDAAPT